MNNNIEIKVLRHPNTMYLCPYCETRTSNSVTEFAQNKIEDGSYSSSVRSFYSLECMTCNNSYFICEDIKQKHLLKRNDIFSVNRQLNPQWGVEIQKVIYPQQVNDPRIPNPSKYMPDDVRNMYKEAASVFSLSPRSSAALIRLTLETLLKKHLVNDGKEHSLNIMIGMSNSQQPELVTEFMDMIRKSGNEEVHPKYEQLEHEWGDITKDTNKEEVLYLFNYINSICDLLGVANKMQSDYDALPDSQKQAIKNRNDKYKK